MLSSYLFVLSLFISFNSIFLFWLFLELNMVIFILFMWFYRNNSFTHLMFYFLIQSFASLLILIFCLDSFNSLEKLTFFIFPIMVFLKMGVYPFHEWVISSSNYLDDKIICLLLTLQKFPLFILVFYFFDYKLILFLSANLIFGRLIVYFCSRLGSIIIFSSIYSTFWFFSRLGVGYNFLLLFLIQYIILLWSLYQIDSLSEEKNVVFIYSGFFLIGIPPFFFFFLKYYSILFLCADLGMLVIILVWFSSFVSFIGYVKFLIKGLLHNWGVYFFKVGDNLNLIILFFLSGILFIF